MSVSSIRVLSTTSALLAGITAVSGPAMAEPRIADFSAKLNGAAPTIYVDAKNGKWHSIANRPVTLQVSVKANAKGLRTFITHMAAGAQDSFKLDQSGVAGPYKPVALAVKSFGGKGDRNKASATLDIVRAGDKLGLGGASESAIVAACNKKLDQGASVFTEQRTSSSGHALWVGVMADYYPAIGGFPKGSVSEKRNVGLAFNVVCLADQQPYKTLGAKLTYKSEGNACPRKLTIRTVIESNKPGSGQYRRERQGGPPSDWISFATKKVGDKFLYVKEETQEVGNVDQVRRIQVKGGPAAPWEHVKVGCDPFKVTHVKYSYKVKAGASCPRPMTTFMSLHANQKGHAFVRHERKGGAPGEWFKVEFKKTNSSYVAKVENTQNVGDVDQTRRLKVKDGPASDWVHFKNDCAPMKVTKVQLGITAAKTNACPTSVTFKSWVFGDKEGWSKVRYRRADGGKSAWYIVKIHKGSGGVYVGSHTVTETYKKAADTKFIAEAEGGKMGNWVPLKISCPTGPGGLTKSSVNPAQAPKAAGLGAKIRHSRQSRVRH